MSYVKYSGLLEAIEERFGERMRKLLEGSPSTDRLPTEQAATAGSGDVLAVVSPTDAYEVELLARLCARRSVPLVAEGAGTTGDVTYPDRAVVVRFDLMDRFSPPSGADHRVVVEPGLSWLELEENLGEYDRSTLVYPTSAPKATVGGWLASDGIGIGSYEFGWLSENLIAVSVVTQDGGRHEISGSHLRHVVLHSGWKTGLIVSATLSTRPAGVDAPLAVGFDSYESLAETLKKIHSMRLPLWHLGFQNADIVRGRVSGTGSMMLFGAYPAERASRVEETLHMLASEIGGRVAATAEAYRVWGSRFFPVSPVREAPRPARVLLPIESLELALPAIKARLGEVMIQGSVARGGEVLLLAFDLDESQPSSLASGKFDQLLDVAGEFGGSGYYTKTTSPEPRLVKGAAG